MEILAVMVAGVLVGATVFPARLKGLNEKLTLAATALLIFSMGVLLAGRDAFLEELGTVGWASVLFCLVPVAFSTIAVYGLTNLLLSDIARRPAGPRVAAAQDADAPAEPASRGEAAMIAVAVGALVAVGVVELVCARHDAARIVRSAAFAGFAVQAAAVVLLTAAMQPYATTLLFALLVVKAVIGYRILRS